MKITTRVIIGFAFIIAIFTMAHLYQNYIIYQMRDVNREISETGFHTALETLELAGRLNDLEEYSRKYLIITDPLYLREVRALESNIDDDLRTLQRLNLSRLSRRERLDRMLEDWIAIQLLLDDLERPSNRQQLDQQIGEGLSALQETARDLILATETEIHDTVANTQAMSARVVSLSWFALLIAVVLSWIISFFLFRSISQSLQGLIHATGRIAAGDFATHVDESKGGELGELGRYLNLMAARLGELDKIKRDFISYVSHDLRAPLASIQETTRLLLENFSDNLNETQHRLLTLNLRSAGRLSNLIGNLLDLTTMQAGVMKFEFEPLEVSELLQSTAEDYYGLCQEKDVSVDFDIPEPSPVVEGDRIRLAQLLGNLISNAIKFSPEGGAILIGVARVDRQGSGRRIEIGVSDEGPGVLEEDKEHVFSQFFSGGKARAKKGTGLGLAISAKIAEAHGGRLRVEDNPAGGARFVFEIAESSERP